MIFNGQIRNITTDFRSGESQITFSIPKASLEAANSLVEKPLEIEANIYSPKRTRQANRLFWKCIQLFADALSIDNWEAYMYMLKRYGVFTSITIRKDAYEDFKRFYRETEIIGEDGDRYVVNCYHGSHEYNVHEFSRLINGVKDEMHELGIHLPMTDEELERSLKLWGRSHP